MEVFNLVKHGNFSYEELMRMPQRVRKRYYGLLMEQFKAELEEMQKMMPDKQ
jgi:hypothetical protein